MRILIFLIISAFLFIPEALAEKPVTEYVQFKEGGNFTFKKVVGGVSMPDKLVMYMHYNEKDGRTFRTRILAPKEIPYHLEILPVRGGVLKTAKKKTRASKLELYSRREWNVQHSVCHPLTIEERAPIAIPGEFWHEICELYPKEELESLASVYSEVTGNDWSIGNVCAFIVDSINQGSSELGLPTPEFITNRFSTVLVEKELYGTVPVNMCNRRLLRRGYVLRYVFDLTKPKIQDIGEFNIAVSFKLRGHDGGRQASIKPESEGRHAPNPIVLMNIPGDLCGNRIEVTKWKKNRIAYTKTLNLYSLLEYRGLILALALVDPVIPGAGKASFYIHDSEEMYGACFRLKRVRQRVNGYPR